jgi:hypothetical protein
MARKSRSGALLVFAAASTYRAAAASRLPARSSRDGVLFQGSGTNWYVPSFSPETGLFYVNANLGGWRIAYLLFAGDDEQPEDHQGGASASTCSSRRGTR